MVFSLKNESVKFNKLNFVSYKKDELNLSGNLRLAGPVVLKGEVVLANPPFRGEIYVCNKDKQNRFIFPVEVESNWSDPEFNIPKSALKKFASNTFDCQKKKAEEKAKKKIKKEIKKIQKDLEGDLENKVKDLFR